MADRIRLWSAPPFALRPARWADGQISFRMVDEISRISSGRSGVLRVAGVFFVGLLGLGWVGSHWSIRLVWLIAAGLVLVSGCTWMMIMDQRRSRSRLLSHEVVFDPIERRFALRRILGARDGVRTMGPLDDCSLERCVVEACEVRWQCVVLVLGPDRDAPRIMIAALESEALVDEYLGLLPDLVRRLKPAKPTEWFDDRFEILTESKPSGRQCLNSLRCCPKCRYDLKGSNIFDCPECGWGKPQSALTQATASGESLA